MLAKSPALSQLICTSSMLCVPGKTIQQTQSNESKIGEREILRA